jgi:hypothetical protein
MTGKKQKLKRNARTGRLASARTREIPTRIVRHARTPGGDEIWHVTAGGRVRKLTTSSSSAKIMDDAVAIYRNALERLAKR